MKYPVKNVLLEIYFALEKRKSYEIFRNYARTDHTAE